ncbi:MAG: DUF2059 domain-containing protein [Nitrospiria bacterium]
MKKSLFVIFVISIFPILLQGRQNPLHAAEPEKLAQELLEVSGVGGLSAQVTKQIIQIQKKAMPDIPNQFWDDFSSSVNPAELNQKIITIYVKHFTVEEMKSIIGFYKTNAGQKLLNKLPILTQESMQAGRQWGMELRQIITKKLQTADLKKKK